MAKYHMNKKEREIINANDLVEILKSGKYAVISMCRNNEPYIVSLSYGYDEANNTLYFHSAQKGLKIDFVKHNPSVCATVIEDKGYVQGQCSHRYSSVVIWGEMALIEDIEGKKHGMDIILNHLEENPEPIKERALKSDEVFDKIAILKLRISELTGKAGQ